MKDIIIFYIIVSICLIINLVFLLKDGYKYSDLFFYYLTVLSIILGLGIYIHTKYEKDLDIIDNYTFKWNRQLENETDKCENVGGENKCLNRWNNSIIPYDLSEIGEETIKRKRYLDMNLSSAYILLGLLLIILLIIIIYLIQNIYYHYQRKKQKKKTFKKKF